MLGAELPVISSAAERILQLKTWAAAMPAVNARDTAAKEAIRAGLEVRGWPRIVVRRVRGRRTVGSHNSGGDARFPPALARSGLFRGGAPRPDARRPAACAGRQRR